MPADHLTAPPSALAAGVLAVLGGTSPEAAAAASALAPAVLDEAVQLYRAAGQAALERRAEHDWYQVHVQFPDWSTAETAGAARLGPPLDRLQASGAMTGWWFLRKHPCWRLRLQLADTAAVGHVLDGLTDAGVLARWWPTVYEPEIAAFGGGAGMQTVHDLFCADTRGALDHLRREITGPLASAGGLGVHAPGSSRLGRRELSILLLSGLLQAAGLDTFERGDVFARAAQLRPAPTDADVPRIEQLARQVRVLLSIPDLPAANSELFASDGPAAHAAPWSAAFQTAGRRLGDAAASGHLDRGIRAILTHVLIFHWNRVGLSATSQGILARAATTALLPPR